MKLLYAGPGARFEVPVAGYRVDVVCGGRLIEIQHGPLAAIRRKVQTLLKCHHVTVVRPIVVPKLLPIVVPKLLVKRWVAHRVAYCLRQTGAIRQMGKRGNALLCPVARGTSAGGMTVRAGPA